MMPSDETLGETDSLFSFILDKNNENGPDLNVYLDSEEMHLLFSQTAINTAFDSSCVTK